MPITTEPVQVRCWRCSRRLLDVERGDTTIAIVCQRCGARNCATIERGVIIDGPHGSGPVSTGDTAL